MDCLSHQECWLYVSGFASQEQKAKVEGHLDHCHSCFGQIVLLMELGQVLPFEPATAQNPVKYAELPQEPLPEPEPAVPRREAATAVRPAPLPRLPVRRDEPVSYRKPFPEPREPKARRRMPPWMLWAGAAGLLVIVVGGFAVKYLRVRVPWQAPVAQEKPKPAVEPQAPANPEDRTVKNGNEGNRREEAVALYTKGLAELASGRFAESVYLLSQAIDLQPDLAEAYLQRANAFFYLGDLHRAMEDSDKAIAMNPKESWAYMVRASVRHELMEFKGAEEDARTALVLRPQPTAFERGQAQLASRQYREAVQSFTQDLAQNQNHAEAYLGRAQARVMLKDPPNAVSDFEAAARIKPGLRQFIYPRLEPLLPKKK